MSDTPETDAAEYGAALENECEKRVVLADIARRLERERDAMRSQVAVLRDALEKSREFVKSWGELNDEEWAVYQQAINAVDSALSSTAETV